MGNSDMCANDCWPEDGGFGRGGHALRVETDDATMECSLDTWANCLEAVSQSQALRNDVSGQWRSAHARYVETRNANRECSLHHILENWLEATSPSTCQECVSDIWGKLLEATSHSQAPNNNTPSSSLACKPDILPAYFSSNISMPSLPNTNALLMMEYSNPYIEHDSHPRLDNMNNPVNVNQHLDIMKSIHDNATNSTSVSISPDIAYPTAPMMYTGSAASCTDCFDDVHPPPQELRIAMSRTGPPPPNLAATVIPSQPIVEARSNPPLHQNLMAANGSRAMENTVNCDTREIVSILVESNTPAIEDGYKWCKYGQKNIKDKMHPRCYFKCAQSNCPVKKQTEGSSDMPGFVMITYFGKHNHCI